MKLIFYSLKIVFLQTVWTINFTNSAHKSYKKLNEKIQYIVDLLVIELEVTNPVRGNWKNYGKLSETEHHCHLKSGHPTLCCLLEKN